MLAVSARQTTENIPHSRVPEAEGTEGASDKQACGCSPRRSGTPAGWEQAHPKACRWAFTTVEKREASGKDGPLTHRGCDPQEPPAEFCWR